MARDPLIETKRCPRCEQHKLVTEFYVRRRAERGGRLFLSSECKTCNVTRTSADRVRFANRSRISGAKARAKQRGIPFNITVNDVEWPSYCPALGIELDYSLGIKGSGGAFNSPSLDRIIPSKGYIKGNVIVVSNLANRIKTDATIDQIERVASYYRQLIPQAGASHV